MRGQAMRLQARLQRLERATAADGCGPDCPPLAVVLYRQDGFDGEPTLDEGQRPPTPPVAGVAGPPGWWDWS